MSVRVNTHMSQIDLHHVPILETHWQLIGKLQYTVWDVSFLKKNQSISRGTSQRLRPDVAKNHYTYETRMSPVQRGGTESCECNQSPAVGRFIHRDEGETAREKPGVSKWEKSSWRQTPKVS